MVTFEVRRREAMTLRIVLSSMISSPSLATGMMACGPGAAAGMARVAGAGVLVALALTAAARAAAALASGDGDEAAGELCAAAVPGLRTTRPLSALHAAQEAGLVSLVDAEALAHSWRLATAIRDAVMLVKGTPSDMVPTDIRELRAVSFVLGYSMDNPGKLLDDYRRVTRRARQVFDRLFYGLDSA